VSPGLAYGALLVFLRGSPQLERVDLGTFVTVAARLLKGDRLYADVFDNKDPFFYYADAVALRLGGWRGPAALDALLLAVGAIAMAGFLRAVTRSAGLWLLGATDGPVSPHHPGPGGRRSL
jgi:hypothetical protein